MPVREFDGVDDLLDTDVGNLAGMTFGTVAAIVKILPDGNHSTNPYLILTTAELAVRAEWGFFDPQTNALNPYAWNGSTLVDAGPAQADTLGEWLLIVTRKASGGVPPYSSVYNYATGTWSHGAGPSNQADWSAPGAGGRTRVAYPGDPQPKLRLAVRAAWSNRLPWSPDSDGATAIESAGLESALDAWLTAQPDALWSFNQPNTATPVQDLAGDAHQVAIVGTTVITGDDPPGFAFTTVDGSGAAALGGLVAAGTGRHVIRGTGAATLGGIVATGLIGTASHGSAPRIVSQSTSERVTSGSVPLSRLISQTGGGRL